MRDVGNTDEHKEENNHLYSSHYFGICPIIFRIDATYIPINIRSKVIPIYVYYLKYMVIHNIIRIYCIVHVN